MLMLAIMERNQLMDSTFLPPPPDGNYFGTFLRWWWYASSLQLVYDSIRGLNI